MAARVPPRLRTRGLEVDARDRTSHHRVMRRLPARQVVGQEHAIGQRRGQAVCEAEVRIRLCEHARDPERTGRKQHRAGHESPAAEHCMRPAAAEDARTRRRGRDVQRERARESRRERAGQPLHAEGVERVPGCPYELRFGAIGRARERHLGPGARELLGYGQRGHDVAGRPSGRDQDARRRHIARRRRARAAPAGAGRAAACGRDAARRRGGLARRPARGSGTASACPP